MTYRPGDPILGYRITDPLPRLVFAVVLTAVRLVDRLLYGLRVVGRAELERAPSAILVSNHTLLLDPGVIAHAIHPRRTYFTMLEQTATAPGIGTFVRVLGAIPIPARRHGREELERAIRCAVEEVGLVHVFPEGECYQWSQEIRPFRRGAFLLALRLGLPVIPVTTVLRDRARARRLLGALLGRPVRLPPRVTVVVGHAVHAPSLASGRTGSMRETADELARAVRHEMQRTIDRLGGSKSLYRGRLPRLVGNRTGDGSFRPVPSAARPPALTSPSAPR